MHAKQLLIDIPVQNAYNKVPVIKYDTTRDAILNMSRLNLPHGNDN